VKGRLFLVNNKVDSGLPVFHVPVSIHHFRGLFKDIHYFFGNLTLALIVRAVYLCNKRGQPRGSTIVYSPGQFDVKSNGTGFGNPLRRREFRLGSHDT